MSGYKYETHLHTSESSSCGRLKAAEQVRIYKDLGYAGIIVTDHLKTLSFFAGSFTQPKPLTSWSAKAAYLSKGYLNAKKEGDKVGLDVFLGWEYYYQGSDFLTYGLNLDFLKKHRDLDKLPIKAYSALVRSNGGFICQAHPYRKLKLGHRKTPVEPLLLDSVEVFNAGRLGKGNENNKAMAFALKHDLPKQSGTDTHKSNRPFYSGIILDKKAESIFDIISAIKSAEAKLILPESHTPSPSP